MERPYQIWKTCQVWEPWHERITLYDGLNFRKILRMSMENIAGEQSPS